MKLMDRIVHSYNAFMNRDPTPKYRFDGPGYSYRPDRPMFTRGNEKTVLTSIFNRIALDVASMTIQHCRLDEDNRFKEIIPSGLNNCLTLEANIDQTARSFIQDLVVSMFDEGVVTAVPIDTSIDPKNSASYDILTMRTGKILEWKPQTIKARVYNDRTGNKEDIVLPKKSVAIIENPFYAVVNETNSTFQRLKRKLSLMDVTDEQTASGKLDLIIQLPYVIKTDARRAEAEKRRREIESQLTSSKYGIAYADGTEKVIQLNRSLENNLMKQVEYLTNQLFSQLNITQSILDGTADEKTMLNYYNRTVEPIVAAIVDEFNRKFLSKTARTQKQAIRAFRDPFRLVPVNDIAEIADKFTRNEIMTSNEIRQAIGMKPSNDPKADQLVNSNISQPEGQEQADYNQEFEEYGGNEYEDDLS